MKPSHVDHSTQNTKGKSSGSNNTRSSSTAYSSNNSVGSSTSNMPQQQQQQSQTQQVGTQSQNAPQSNNNPSANGNSSGSNSVSNYHPHGGYGGYAVHHGGHGLYPVINAGLQPGNVYVNNVTANVNVGWGGHPTVQAAYIPNSQSYIAAGSTGHPVEVVGDQVSWFSYFTFDRMICEGF